MASGAVELTQVMVASFDPNDGEILGLVMAVLEDAGGSW